MNKVRSGQCLGPGWQLQGLGWPSLSTDRQRNLTLRAIPAPGVDEKKPFMGTTV